MILKCEYILDSLLYDSNFNIFRLWTKQGM